MIFVSRLLKDKRASDESFNKFLELKRGAAMHTLESLMLLPVSGLDLSPLSLSFSLSLSPPPSLPLLSLPLKVTNINLHVHSILLNVGFPFM